MAGFTKNEELDQEEERRRQGMAGRMRGAGVGGEECGRAGSGSHSERRKHIEGQGGGAGRGWRNVRMSL
eukprot:753214-Hanusia_phi.AAC.3